MFNTYCAASFQFLFGLLWLFPKNLLGGTSEETTPLDIEGRQAGAK